MLNMTSVILNVVKNLPEGWFSAERKRKTERGTPFSSDDEKVI